MPKKEAERILGNNNPTHFLSFFSAVNCNGLEGVHAHVHMLTSETLCVCVCVCVINTFKFIFKSLVISVLGVVW